MNYKNKVDVFSRKNARPENHNDQNSQCQLLLEIVDWLETKPSCPPDPDEICQRFGITNYRLKQLFKKEFGKPPGTWMRNKRLALAARHLTGSDKTIATIAESIGYLSPSRFAAAFKKEYGCNPDEYRQNEAQ